MEFCYKESEAGMVSKLAEWVENEVKKNKK